MNRIYSNVEVADLLQNIATAYEIKHKNIFKITAYQNAADTIVTYPKPIQKIWIKNPKKLDGIPNIGSNILAKIDFLFKYNTLHPDIVKTFKNIQPCVFTFTKVKGIGPKIAYKLSRHLKFSSDSRKALTELIKYAECGKIRTIPTFGLKTEKMILDETLNFLNQKVRMSFKVAQIISQTIIDYIHQKFPKVEVIALGSLRRQSKTIGDIDLAVKNSNSTKIINHFIKYPDVLQVIDQGNKKASILIKNNVRVDIMVQPKQNFASLVQHFTGSKQHNVNLRKYAKSLNLSISEYGIKNLVTGKIHIFKSENQLYNFLKLCYIEPKNRIGEKEIELAQKCYNKNVKD